MKFDIQTIAQLSAEYRALSSEEKERYVAAGQAASLAHKTGFKAFGKRRAAPAANVAEVAALPGASSSSGALIAMDAPSGLDLAVQYHGQDTFANRYEHVLEDLRLARGESELALSEAERVALQKVSNEAGAEPLVQEAEQRGHNRIAGSFCKFAANLQGLVMLRWLSPVMSLLRVSGQRQHDSEIVFHD